MMMGLSSLSVSDNGTACLTSQACYGNESERPVVKLTLISNSVVVVFGVVVVVCFVFCQFCFVSSLFVCLFVVWLVKFLLSCYGEYSSVRPLFDADPCLTGDSEAAEGLRPQLPELSGGGG